MAMRFEMVRVELAGVRLHAVTAGEGPLVVMLHGFPDYHGTWGHQIGRLAASGRRVVAPDMRGYNLSSKPRGLGAYRLDALAGDVRDLVRAFGEDSAAVVGHDWGGVVAWHAALRHPGLVERLAILNAPPPLKLMGRLLPPDQLARSWYVLAFQVPWLPEAALGGLDGWALRYMLMRELSHPSAMGEAEREALVAAMRQPGALTAALNYYRALPWYGPLDAARQAERFEAPVLVLWGDRDPHLAPALAALNVKRVPQQRTVHVPEAGHWVHWDARERVNDELAAFLAVRSEAKPAGR